MGERIERVEAWLCPLTMAYELHLGAISYTTRDYVVVRLTSSSGCVGAAVGYTRNTPLLHAVRELAQHLRNVDYTDPLAVAEMLRRRYAPGWGSMVRAASLIDIALWDITAQLASTPLAAVLGGAERTIPLMVVAGYFLDQRGHGAILEEVRQFVDEGYQTVKLIVAGQDLSADLTLVSAVTQVLPESVGLAVDFHGAFTSPQQAIGYCRAFESAGLKFIEDPFASYEISAVCAVATAIDTPVAAGEDVITATSYDQLVDGGVRYLRADVTASGGYSSVHPALGRAGAAGAIVAPHVWPHLHVPLAAASPAVGMIEVIPHSTGADPIDVLLAEPFPIAEGSWTTPSQDGLYLPLDWERVASRATEYWASE